MVCVLLVSSEILLFLRSFRYYDLFSSKSFGFSFQRWFFCLECACVWGYAMMLSFNVSMGNSDPKAIHWNYPSIPDGSGMPPGPRSYVKFPSKWGASAWSPCWNRPALRLLNRTVRASRRLPRCFHKDHFHGCLVFRHSSFCWESLWGEHILGTHVWN